MALFTTNAAVVLSGASSLIGETADARTRRGRSSTAGERDVQVCPGRCQATASTGEVSAAREATQETSSDSTPDRQGAPRHPDEAVGSLGVPLGMPVCAHTGQSPLYQSVFTCQTAQP
jgi:hypothetical protein